MLSPLLEQIAVGAPGETVGMVIRNASPTGAASLLERRGRAGGAVGRRANKQLPAVHQFQQHQRPGESGHRAQHRGQQRRGGDFGYGFVNLSDRALKENVRAIPEEELQETFDKVEPQISDRTDGGRGQIGFVAQDVQASGKLGATMCKTKEFGRDELMALDYQKLSVVLWGVVKKLQKRVDKLV